MLHFWMKKNVTLFFLEGVKTIVFSADAATEPLYSKLRVNGNLSKVLKNIENFKKIKETKYPKNPIISRVSGVKFNDEQNINSMEKFWGDLVDQVAFVNYNPWENSYTKAPNKITGSLYGSLEKNVCLVGR